MTYVLWFLGILSVGLLLVFGMSFLIDSPQRPPTLTVSDGRHFGFVYSISATNSELSFDDARWLTGIEAEDAAIRKGMCTEETRSECLPNDYFIENVSELSTVIPMRDNVQIVMQTWTTETTSQIQPLEISIGEFEPKLNSEELHWHHLPYYITVEEGRVSKIEEVYVP